MKQHYPRLIIGIIIWIAIVFTGCCNEKHDEDIRYNISITSPDTGAQWMAQTNHLIEWTDENVYAFIAEYTLDGGLNWFPIGSHLDSNSVTWHVPDTSSDNCRVRVAMENNEIVCDTSETFSIFRIPVYNITLLSPSSGAILTVGMVHLIRWTDQNVDSFRVEYSIDGGAVYSLIAAAVAANDLAWIIPNTPSEICRIRVSKFGDATLFATSGVFTIALPPIVDTWDALDNTIEPLNLDSLVYVFNMGSSFSRLFRLSQTTVIESGTYETDGDSLRFHVTVSDGQPVNETYAFWYSLAQNNTILTIRITEASEVYPVTFTRVP